MRVAINIEGQARKMTGIQHYVDGLMTALYRLETEHELVAFAPILDSPEQVAEWIEPGTFEWLKHPAARLDTVEAPLYAPEQHTLQARHSRADTSVMATSVLLQSGIRQRQREKRAQMAAGQYPLFHTPEPGFETCPKYAGQRNVVTIFDLATRITPWAFPQGGFETWENYYAFAKHRCARVITISEATKRTIVEHLGIPEDRIDVTPLAGKPSAQQITDAATIKRLLAPLHLPDKPFVLYSGTLEPRKNLGTLVRAFRDLVKQNRSLEHVLILAGGNWNDLDLEMRILSYELGIGGRVLTPGYVSNAEMNALMSSCEAFAYISKFEGFGLPPLEAMTCGAPVITSNTSSLPEVVGNAGLLVNPAQVEDVASALHCLLTNPQENSRRRRLSLERAREFSWERTAALTIQSYEAASA